MALVTEKMLFLHIPKCAGMWIRQVFSSLDIKHWEIGDQHTRFPQLLDYHDKSFYDNKFIFLFVRHPIYWYQSRWAFRMKHGWRPTHHPLDYSCMSNNFEVFMQNVLDYKPNGWATYEFCNYIDTCPSVPDFIGRVEYLIDDMINALEMAGEKCDRTVINSLPKINDSDLDDKPPKYWAKYTLELYNSVIAADQEIIRRYYYNYEVSPNIL